MQLIRSGSVEKPNTLSTVVRNTSCSHGWLRYVVQCLFAAITVTSFMLIFRTTIVKESPHHHTPRCSLSGCKVMCREAPFFGDFEYDIVQAVSDANQEYCRNIMLHLDNPMFANNTLSINFLSKLRTNIHELTINNGNLMHIPPDAFMGRYLARVRTLTFYNLIIRTWTAESFVGLMSLRKLILKDCILVNAPRDPLRAVGDTLVSLSITNGDKWDPAPITGLTTFSALTVVDFSANTFDDILGPSSFTGLQNCRALYLNSCKISAIRAGAFDSLQSIEDLFLHNNYLIELPDHLFSNVISIVNPKPRINLQNNLWHCNCSDRSIRALIKNNMLLTDPVCGSPDKFKHKTFSEFESYCTKNENEDIKAVEPITTLQFDFSLGRPEDSSGFIYVSSGSCYNGNSNNISYNSALTMISPIFGNGCSTRTKGLSGIERIPYFREVQLGPTNIDNSWIKFTYLIKTLNYSVLQIGTLDVDDYGIVWYQSTCPNEVYCVSHVPHMLRIYNADADASYVFCPIKLNSVNIDFNKCVYHEVNGNDNHNKRKLEIFHYLTTGLICLVCGALCVYAVILKYPNLLKGSKRILLVKHKKVDALVLPPKVPIRNEFIREGTPNFKESKIFVIPATHYIPRNSNRNRSMRSMKSNAPSYISALQPTEDQLAEWRIRYHFNNDLSITSTHSEVSVLSWNNNDDTPYSIDFDNERIYESLK